MKINNLMQSRLSFPLLILMFSMFIVTFSFAEGTKEAAPNGSVVIEGNTTNDVAALLINHTEYNRFATYTNNDPNSRLYIHIEDPNVECIYLGLSVGHVNGNNSNPTQLSYEYRIKDPNGNVVFGPITINPGDENISNWSEAFNGPMELVGSSGYNQTTISNSDLMAAGWSTSGDYYIEFQNLTTSAELLIDFWDFSVVNCQTTVPTYKPGRVWSYNWAFFAINDFGFPNRPFNGSFHVCAPDPDDLDRAFITKIDFNDSGFQPAAFNVAFNSFGSQNTGTISVDRQSREEINSTQSEYAIFLNDPVDLCETALSGEISLLGISRCSNDDYCIKFTATKEGQVELLLDFDGNDNIYTPGTADVQIAQDVTAADVGVATCLNWNGLNGLGQSVIENMATTIPVTIAFAQGIYHFPIYDAEYMFNGFNISSVRPSGPTPKLYYDDSNITTPSGSLEPTIQLSGCTLPCHRWTTYDAPSNAPGFGNLNTINSWWFSQLLIEEELFFLPGYYVCDVIGPDTLCGDDIDTLKLALQALPTGISNPAIVSQQWSGPGIVGASTGAEIIIDAGGSYHIDITWTNNLGDVCRTNCIKTVIATDACCAVSMHCNLDSTWYACDENVPLPASTPNDLMLAGLLEVTDAGCAILRMSVEVTVESPNCATQPKTTTYSYLVWNDENGNGQADNDELQVECQQVYLTQDMTPPSLEFTGDLMGMESGDTLFIQCQAADPNWSMPIPSVDDISVNDDCSEVTVALKDEILEGDCMVDGYIKSYRCSWLATDDCGNENELHIYMLLIDHIPPTITDVAPDMTITCKETIPEAHSTATDECNCAHLSMELDTTYYICSSAYELRRTYTWTDHCGNNTSAQQLITIKDEQPLNITLPNGYVSGQEIEINCQNGTFPFWLTEFNKASIDVNSGCNVFSTQFDFEQIESNDCSAGYLSKYKLNWIVTDDCGRSNDAHFIAKIVDREAPVILLFPDIKCDGTFDPSALIADDNCGVAQIVHDEIVEQASCGNTYDVKHTWHVFDQCGNTTYGEVIVRVGDNEAPQLSLLPPYHNLTAGSTLEIDCQTSVEQYIKGIDIDVENRCGKNDITKELNLIEAINCQQGHIGLHQIIWTVNDDCGNTSTFDLFIKIKSPDLSNLIPDAILNLTCGGDLPEVDFEQCVNKIEITAEHIQSRCSNQLSFRAYTITGLCGQIISDTLWMTFVDEDAPVFNDIPDEVCASSDLPPVRAWDECEQRFVPVNVYQRQENICGLLLNVITYSAFDQCGNEARKDVTVVPSPIEHYFSAYYDQIELLPGILGWPFITENCPFELDINKFTFAPNCSILKFDIAYQLQNKNCSNSAFYEHRLYTIDLVSICGIQQSFHLNVLLRDQIAPLFLEPLADITISCIDTIAFPDLETWDNCSDVIIVKDQITLPGQPGLTQHMQSWTATDACGNENQHERIVSQFSAPNCEIIVPDHIRCHSSFTLQNMNGPAAAPLTYEWIISQGDCIITNQGSSGSTIEVVMFSDTAMVTLIVTDVFGCQSECEVLLICDDKPDTPQSLSSAISVTDQDVVVFPNPFADAIYFRHQRALASIVISDIHGRIMKSIQPSSNSGTIDVSAMHAGLYFIEINSVNQKAEVFRLLKM